MKTNQDILKEVVKKNLAKDLAYLPTAGYNEVEMDYKLMTNSDNPKSIFVISKIIAYDGNKLVDRKFGVYPYTLKGEFDSKFDVDKICKGTWFLKLKEVDETI